MKITYYGHACFTVESSGHIVALDPFKGVRGFSDVNIKANQVVCSHEHFDHNYIAGVIIESKQNSVFDIQSIPVFHDDKMGGQRGNNNITILSDGERKIAHFGDLGHDLSEDLCKVLSGLDAIMIPVGGVYTIDAKLAAELVKKLSPKYIIPMHYKDGEYGLDVVAPVEDFISYLSEEEKQKLLLVKGYFDSVEI